MKITDTFYLKQKNKKTAMAMFLVMVFVLVVLGIIAILNGGKLPGYDNGATPEAHDMTPGKKMSVTFLDVGQGDCSFIELPNGKCILIDAGENENAAKIKRHIKNAGYEKIDYVVATHPHTDHIGAMAKVIKAFDVGNVYMPRAESTTKTYKNLLEAVGDKELGIKKAKAGVVMIDEDGIFAQFVAPTEDKYESLNNYSAVLKLTYKNASFLFTGDAEKESERQIKDDIDADILKVGHHGSGSSSTSSFLGKVSPDLCIISCGENNDYGHPHKEVISRLEKQGTEYLRTDLSGDIKIVTDGIEYEIITEKN